MGNIIPNTRFSQTKIEQYIKKKKKCAGKQYKKELFVPVEPKEPYHVADFTCGECANSEYDYSRKRLICGYSKRVVGYKRRACVNWLNINFCSMGMDDRVCPEKWNLSEGGEE